MPRANRRRRDERPIALDRVGPTTQEWDGRSWSVRRVSGVSDGGGGRTRLCPGCSQDIAPGTPHVVVWPADGVGGVGDRRHWHTSCWNARGRWHARGSTR